MGKDFVVLRLWLFLFNIQVHKIFRVRALGFLGLGL